MLLQHLSAQLLKVTQLLKTIQDSHSNNLIDHIGSLCFSSPSTTKPIPQTLCKFVYIFYTNPLRASPAVLSI
jgi:hypothetical protein